MTSRIVIRAIASIMLASAVYAQAEPLTFDPSVHIGNLDNGLTYMIRENKKPENRVELRLVVNAGSILEEDDQQGLAHFLEHMAFNGTKSFKKHELVDYLEAIGMRFGPDLNAYTSFDETVYMLQVPLDNPERLDTGFKILSEWAQAVANEEEEIDKERGVVIEERRRRQGASQRIRDKQLPVLFHQSQYAVRLPIGILEVLENGKPERIRDFYNTWYRPNLMAVIAVGDIEKDRIESLIKKHFSGLKNPKGAPDRTKSVVPDHTETLVSIETDPEATRTSLAVYFKRDVDDMKTEADYRRLITEQLFISMFNQRLDEIRKQPDAPFLMGFGGKGSMVRAKSVFVLRAGVKDNGVTRGLEALLTEAERVNRHGFTKSELERTKASRMRALQTAFKERETTESRAYATSYIHAFLNEEVEPGIEAEVRMHEALMDGIELAEINQLAKDWVRDENRVVLVSGPEKPDVKMPSKDDLLKLFKQAKKQNVAAYADDTGSGPLLADEPKPSRIERTERIHRIGVTTWTFGNGVRLIMKPTDFKKDQILLSAFSPGGHSMSPDADFIPAVSASAAMRESGLGSYSQTQLRKKLAGKVASASPYINDLEEGLNGQCSPEDLETLLQLTYLWFTQPRTDPKAFEAYQARKRAELKNRLANPSAVFSDLVKETMSQGHVRQKPWTQKTVDHMDLDKSLSVYKERFADGDDFTFLLVGNFDPKEIKDLARKYIGGLPSLEGSETWVDHDIEPPKGVVEKSVKKGQEPKSSVIMYFTGPMEWSRENRLLIRSMAGAFSIRLREKLREEMGGTYSVSAYANYEHYPESTYQIRVGFDCAPENVDPMIKAVYAEIENIQKNPLDEIYLTKVREGQIKGREVAMKTNGFWVEVLKFYDWHNENPLDLLEMEDLINSLSLEQIQQAAKKYFSTKNVATFVLYPEESK